MSLRAAALVVGAALLPVSLPACGGEDGDRDQSIARAPRDPAAMRERRQRTRGDGRQRAPQGRQQQGGRDLDDGGGAVSTLETLGDGTVQEIVTREFAGKNEQFWREEMASNELVSGPLLQLNRHLRGLDSAGPLEKIFTAQARIAAPRPGRTRDESVADGVNRRIWSGKTRLLSREAWLKDLTGLQAAASRVRWALVKPARVAFSDNGELEAVLKWKLNVELQDGGIRHDSGKWRSVWERVEGEARTDCEKCGVGESCGCPGGGGDDWLCRLLEPMDGMTSLVSEAPWFVDVTLEALGGTPLDPRLPQHSGGFNRGVALRDLDADGDLDIVVTLPNRVLLNRGDGTFEDGSARVGMVPEKGFYGVLVEDFDRDGDMDIILAAKRQHSLFYEGKGPGRFERRQIKASRTDNIPASLSAHDVDGDGWLDIFICGYGPFLHPGPSDPANATNGRRNQMLKGGPGGRFRDVTREWGLDVEGTRWSFMGAWGDADGDGDIDLYSAHDFGPNVLYRREDVDGRVHFTAEVEDPDEINAGFSMSATWADLDGDGDRDMYVSNMSSTAANRVAAMPGDPGQGAGVNDLRRKMSKGNTVVLFQDGRMVEAGEDHGGKDANWAWGTALSDFDCDGDLDIQCVNGFWSQGADDGRDL